MRCKHPNQHGSPYGLGQGGTYEDDYLVDTVDKLGREVVADRTLDKVPRGRLDRAFTHVIEESGAEVARHDDHRVAEVDNTALAVCEPSIVKHL